MKLHKNIKLLAWFNFFLSFRFYFPIAILYFAKVTGSYALGMSIFSIAMVSSAIFEIPTGIYSDKIGRRKTIIIGSVFTLLSVFFYALGSFFWILAFGALLEGVARSFYSGNNDALLHDSLRDVGKESEYSEYKGKTMSAEQIAIAIAAISGAFIAHWSFELALWLSVIPAVVGFIISFKFIEPEVISKYSGNMFVHLNRAIQNFKKNKDLRLLSISTALGYAQGESGWLFRSAFNATLWPIWAIGFAQALSNIGSATSSYYAGWLVKRFGALKILLTGKTYALLTNTIAVTLSNVFSPLILASNSVFYGAGNVSKSTLLQKEYSEGERATMDSLNSLLGSIFFGIIAISLGLVADKLTPGKAILLLQGIALISLILIGILFRRKKK